MEQKQVKIIGLELKSDLGILKAHRLKFDTNNKLIVIKGEVGAGKTTEQTALKLGTQGGKTLHDKNLYGAIDTETQLLDGDLNIWVGCKSTDLGGLQYVIYTKDYNGKIVKNPIIDGIKATPASYLELLQTKLTWRMDELTSENINTQRDILLELYQHKLLQLGVIFDKKNPAYADSILGKIDTAQRDRDYKDMQRKERGGIAEDLKLKGCDPDRPETVPDYVNLNEIETQIRQAEKAITLAEAAVGAAKQNKLNDIKTKAAGLVLKAMQYNNELRAKYEIENETYNKAFAKHIRLTEIKKEIENLVIELKLQYNISLGNNEIEIENFDLADPVPPKYIQIENGQITDKNRSFEIVNELFELREKYFEIDSAPTPLNDLSEYETEVKKLQAVKGEALETNKIVLAVDSFHAWREANGKVAKLQNEYYQLLKSVDTGVSGLQINGDDSGAVWLTYNGAYDSKYFNNSNGEARKISSYSGTQKPIIALLVQNYLLSQKPKALRYLYIDNVPIDNKTRALIENICIELDITVFMNITGDFTRDGLMEGEILIENGEVFFK